MTKFYQEKATIWMWIGLCVLGFFQLVFGAIGAAYFDDDLRCGNSDAYDRVNAPSCSTLSLLQAAFIISGIVIIVGSLIKLNTMKLVSLVAAIALAIIAILGLAYIGSYMSDDLTEGHSDAMKSNRNAPGVYIFGTSVGLS